MGLALNLGTSTPTAQPTTNNEQEGITDDICQCECVYAQRVSATALALLGSCSSSFC